MAQDKKSSETALSLHVFIYTIVLAVVTAVGALINGQEFFWSWLTLAGFVGVFIIHWLQDFIKGHYIGNGKQGFYIDQSIHLITLFALRILILNG